MSFRVARCCPATWSLRSPKRRPCRISPPRACSWRRCGNLVVRFALDDFGVGYSSFNYVKQLPVDYVKIDGSFVRTLVDSPDDQVFVRALAEVARGFGKKTVAEFVEDERALEHAALFRRGLRAGLLHRQAGARYRLTGRLSVPGCGRGGPWRRCYNRPLTCHHRCLPSFEHGALHPWSQPPHGTTRRPRAGGFSRRKGAAGAHRPDALQAGPRGGDSLDVQPDRSLLRHRRRRRRRRSGWPSIIAWHATRSSPISTPIPSGPRCGMLFVWPVVSIRWCWGSRRSSAR